MKPGPNVISPVTREPCPIVSFDSRGNVGWKISSFYRGYR